MFRLMIRGRSMDIRSWRGRDGIRTLASGLAARICHLELGSELAGGEGMVGDGATGDSTGITITPCLTTAGITRRAERSTTEPISIGLEESGVEWGGAEVSTVPGLRPGRSTGTDRRLGDMQLLVGRAVCDRALSAATTMADRQGAFLRAASPASVA